MKVQTWSLFISLSMLSCRISVNHVSRRREVLKVVTEFCRPVDEIRKFDSTAQFGDFAESHRIFLLTICGQPVWFAGLPFQADSGLQIPEISSLNEAENRQWTRTSFTPPKMKTISAESTELSSSFSSFSSVLFFCLHVLPTAPRVELGPKLASIIKNAR